MKVLTWNMAYMKPSRHKTIQNRRRQWALLGALSPDVALLQECRPGDLANLAPTWMADEYDIVGEIPHRWIACSAVLARKSFRPASLDRTRLPEAEQRWLGFFAGYVATAQLNIGGTDVSAASVHAIAAEVDDVAVTQAEHLLIKRPALDRAWYNDTVAAALLPTTRGTRFIIGGDWNTALLFDKTYPATAPASAEFFAARAAVGWHHALRKFNPDEVRTFLDPKSDAYELDHLFTDSEFHAALTDCRVLADPAFSTLSDHAPLVAEFANGEVVTITPDPKTAGLDGEGSPTTTTSWTS